MALYRLAALTGEQRYGNQADQILKLLGAVMPGPRGFGLALAAVDLRAAGSTEVVIAGDRPDLVRPPRAWLPNGVVAWGERSDSPLWGGRQDGGAYVCERYACQTPQTTPEGLRAQLVAHVSVSEQSRSGAVRSR